MLNFGAFFALTISSSGRLTAPLSKHVSNSWCPIPKKVAVHLRSKSNIDFYPKMREAECPATSACALGFPV